MSATVPEPEETGAKQRVAVVLLIPPTLDEIARQTVRRCDGCGEEQIYGCFAAVHLGFAYGEICTSCMAQLHDTALIVGRSLKKPASP